MEDDLVDLEANLHTVLRVARDWQHLSLRALSRASGVSVAQLSRLESGQVAQPSIETLLALAPALNMHPTPLLVLGGHLTGERGREELLRLFDQAEEAIRAEWDEEEIERIRGWFEEPPTAETLCGIARYFVEVEVEDALVQWPFSAVVPAKVPDHKLLARIVESWPRMSPKRRQRLADLAHDLERATAAEEGDHE